MGASQRIAPGTVFGGDYVVERTLAAGGMGAVYVVRQRSTQKLRALKTLLPEHVADPSMRARFAREAVAGSHIESDHIVEVLAAGVDEPTGIPWIVMEFLQGDDLGAAKKKRGSLTRQEVIDVARQLGHALMAAHRGGVVHRDLKPENLFLANARREGVAVTLKVLDFGIARLLHTTSIRATTSAMGSPLWMAPEQTDAALEITPATDVWAVGLIFFWALTGTHFWLTPRQPDGTIGSMIRELLTEPLPRASERAAAFGVADRLPQGFDAWFARCVVRDARARFRDASECFPPLLALLDGASAAVAPAAPPAVAASAAPMLAATQQHDAASMISPTMAAPAAAQSSVGYTALPAAPQTPPMSQGAPAVESAHVAVSPVVKRSKVPFAIAGALSLGLVGVIASVAMRGRDPSVAMQDTVAQTSVTSGAKDGSVAPAPMVTTASDAAVASAPGTPTSPRSHTTPTPGVPTPIAFDAGSALPLVVDAGVTPPTTYDPPPDRPLTLVDPVVTPDVPPAPSPDVPPAPSPDVPPAPSPDVQTTPTITPTPTHDAGAATTTAPTTPVTPDPTPDPTPAPEGCERHSNCSSCLADSACGWCQAQSRCLRGNWAHGATNGSCSGSNWVGDSDQCDDRCARFSNCSSCLHESGCGWCNNANRCVSGNWARGPYHGLCSGSNWVGSADHCDDRCARQTTCGSCVNETGCGWCSNVRRCVAGNWAHGPYNGACSGAAWAGQESQCP